MTVTYRISPVVKRQELDALLSSAWPKRAPTKAGRSKTAPLRQALVYVCAYEGNRLIGFIKVIGDGGVHGFLLDPTVAPDRQRRGIGRKLVEACARESRRRGVEWLHVDYEPQLAPFYRACGFTPSKAGLRNLKAKT